ncbi:MAG: sensor hybrid histidine kinase [Rhodocyclales bacterium]|nr:sensor hybrid histidine kinase [Rhodocyclales bacterium]
MSRILIVEDNEDVADVFAELVEMLGHRSAIAHDVERGLALAASWKPDLVLCDLGLPGDGLEFARACKLSAALRDIRLVAMSGRDRPEDREAALDAGFDKLIGKPVDFATLKTICAAA